MGSNCGACTGVFESILSYTYPPALDHPIVEVYVAACSIRISYKLGIGDEGVDSERL